MTGFVLFGSVLAVLLTAIVWSALRSGADTGAALEPDERRDAAIEALRELEFEYGTGKLSEQEYRAIRERIRREALDARDAVPGGACSNCGQPLEGAETYCPACGHEV